MTWHLEFLSHPDFGNELFKHFQANCARYLSGVRVVFCLLILEGGAPQLATPDTRGGRRSSGSPWVVPSLQRLRSRRAHMTRDTFSSDLTWFPVLLFCVAHTFQPVSKWSMLTPVLAMTECSACFQLSLILPGRKLRAPWAHQCTWRSRRPSWPTLEPGKFLHVLGVGTLVSVVFVPMKTES